MLQLLLAVIYLSFISLGLPDSLLGSAWPSIYPSFGVPVSYAGAVSMIIAAGTVLSSLMSDRLTRRLGAGRVTAISVGMTAAALWGFSVSGSFPMLCLWAIPYGLGAGSVDAALNNYVALHYASRHMSWLHCMWGVGASLGPFLMGQALAGSGGWSAGYRWVAMLQIALTLVLVLSLPLWDRPRTQTARASGPQDTSCPGGTEAERAREVTPGRQSAAVSLRQTMGCPSGEADDQEAKGPSAAMQPTSFPGDQPTSAAESAASSPAALGDAAQGDSPATHPDKAAQNGDPARPAGTMHGVDHLALVSTAPQDGDPAALADAPSATLVAPPATDGDAAAPGRALSLPQILAIPGAKEVMGAFFCYSAFEATTGLWASSFLVLVRGLAAADAAACASLFYLGITVGRALAGFLTLKFSDTAMIRLGQSIVAVGLLAFVLPFGAMSAQLGLVLVGLGCAPIYPSIIHATPARFGASRSQAIIGVQMASAYVGSCLMPPLFGLLASFASPALLPVFLGTALVLMALLHERLVRRTRA